MNRETWNGLQFYESADVLKQLAQERIGFKMNSGQAQDIRACLFQGKQYFQSADEADLTIKPLLLFYGMSSLAMAVTMLLGGKAQRRLNMLPASHGLQFIGDFNSLEEASCKVLNRGTFGGFNDAIARNEDFDLPPTGRHSGWKVINETTAQLQGRELGLRDLWSCYPALVESYYRTFREYPAVIQVTVQDCSDPSHWDHASGDLSLRPSLGFEETWREVQHRFGTYASASSENVYLRIAQAESVPIYFLDQCRTIHGPQDIGWGWLCFRDSRVLALAPLSCLLSAMFILGMIVRYKPGLWHRVARLGSNDRAMAYTRNFVDHCEGAFPEGVLKLLDTLCAGCSLPTVGVHGKA